MKVTPLIASCTAVLAAWGAPAIAQSPRFGQALAYFCPLPREPGLRQHVGEFPDANGIANAGQGAVQRDRDKAGADMLPALEKPFDIAKNPPEVRDIAILDNLPNAPFAIEGIRGVAMGTYAGSYSRVLHASEPDPWQKQGFHPSL